MILELRVNAIFLMWPYMHTGLNSAYFSHFAVVQEKCGPGLGLGSPGSLWNVAWTVEMSEEPRSVFSLLASCFPPSRALSEKIVSVLPRMKCPHQLEPHQIQGMDFIHIFPVVQVSASEGFLVLCASACSCDGSGSRAPGLPGLDPGSDGRGVDLVATGRECTPQCYARNVVSVHLPSFLSVTGSDL